MYILSLSTGVKFGLETVQSARSSRLLPWVTLLRLSLKHENDHLQLLLTV